MVVLPSHGESHCLHLLGEFFDRDGARHVLHELVDGGDVPQEVGEHLEEPPVVGVEGDPSI